MARDIREWLEELGLGAYVETLLENQVDLDAARDLTEADLRELAIPMGPRKKLLRAIEILGDSSVTATPGAGATAGPAQPGTAERRQLTVMFCDLVGSTALSARLDPEDLRELLRRYQDAASGAVKRYGGHVAKYLGDGVLAYFGWPQAYEDQAERAVRAGLDAVAAVGNLRTDDGDLLTARVGIASGQVVVGDIVGEGGRDAEAVTGETPNLAARLQGEAKPGQVVMGATTRGLVAGAMVTEKIGTRALKGFADPVPIWRALGEKAAEIYRLRGLFELTASGDAAKAEAQLKLAQDTACSQSARSLELRAATDRAGLLRTQGKIEEAQQLLSPLYGWFTEGFDTADLIDAKALLDELS